jgi:hypothetical protein
MQKYPHRPGEVSPTLPRVRRAALTSISGARRSGTLILAVLALIATSAHAESPTIGSDTLLRWMQSKDERANSLAVGYVGGVRDATFEREHCASTGTSVQDVMRFVQRTLGKLPQPQNVSALEAVTVALKARWPCRDKASAGGR